jgi:hypothetical protein
VKKLLVAAALGLVSLVVAGKAQAQIITPFRPNPFGAPYSPYYNPFSSTYRGSTFYPNSMSPYAGVPATNAGQIAATGATAALTTGHPTRFLYYSHYFLNQGGTETPAYTNPFGMGSTGVPGPFGLGSTGAVITPRVILGVQPHTTGR